MAFTSSVQISKDLFANLINTSGGMFMFAEEQAWRARLFVASSRSAS